MNNLAEGMEEKMEEKQKKIEPTEKEKKEAVCRILQTPIICETKKEKISYDFNGEVIRTGQKYYSRLDEDMSDFAIKFYEIVYSKNILTSDGTLVNFCFAGDTMNSFNSIANLVPEAGKTKKERKKTNKEDWKNWLRDYEKKYHCLANFWLLPSCLGRRGTKLNRYDSMDIFLEKLESNYKEILLQYNSYYDYIVTFSDFKEKHYITEYNINSDALSMYQEKNAEKRIQNAETLIQNAETMMKKRAEKICEKHYEKLWKYFHDTCKLC